MATPMNMNELVQVAPGVCVLHDAQDKSNTGIVLHGNTALVVRSSSVGERASVEAALVAFFRALGRDIDGLDLVLPISTTSEVSTASAAETLDSADLPLPGWTLLMAPPSGRQLAWNATDRVLFSGDLLTGIDVPALPHGGREYLQSLDRIESLDPKLVVPSRGDVAQGKREVRSRIERERRYVWSLQRHVQTALASNVPVERTLAGARTVYEDYPFVDAHLANLRAVWDETLRSLAEE